MKQDEDCGGLLSRAELEIELARLVLAVEGRWPGVDAREPAPQDLAAWFERKGTDLLDRLAPSLRPFCLERLQQMARSNAGLELTTLELDQPALGFAAANASDNPSTIGR